jgi:hypothetical protein
MPKNSKLAPVIKVKGLSITDPRVAMRALMGLLLLANLVAAVIAFKPFGASADDLRKTQASIGAQLRQATSRVESTRQHVAKIEIARSQGDEFLAKYIMDRRSASETVVAELTKAAADAGIRPLGANGASDPIEGSDTLRMESITAGFEGTYAALTKLVNLLDKSGQFLIIDSLNLTAPQQTGAHANDQQNLNVTMKVLTFVRDDTGVVE